MTETGTPNAATISALKEALEDEYKARATYQAVIDAFGPVRPFINIVESEGRHIEALLALFDRYDLEVPPDQWDGQVETPASVADACAQAVEAEIENDAMYDRFLAHTEELDIKTVFKRLQAASRDNHLPAFQRCLDRESRESSGNQGGRGARRRRGRAHGPE